MIHGNSTSRTALAMTFGAIMLLAAACDSVMHFRRATHSAIGLSHEDRVRSFDLECPDGIESLTATIESAPSTGHLRWQVRDPDGEIRWAGDAHDTTEEQRSFTPRTGVWTVRFELSDFSGNYHVDVRAQSVGH